MEIVEDTVTVLLHGPCLTLAWEDLTPLYISPASQQKGPWCVEASRSWEVHGHHFRVTYLGWAAGTQWF